MCNFFLPSMELNEFVYIPMNFGIKLIGQVKTKDIWLVSPTSRCPSKSVIIWLKPK